MAFPYYANVFYPKVEKQNIVVADSNNFQTASFTVKGMSYKGCEAEVNHELYKIKGVIDAQNFL